MADVVSVKVGNEAVCLECFMSHLLSQMSASYSNLQND